MILHGNLELQHIFVSIITNLKGVVFLSPSSQLLTKDCSTQSDCMHQSAFLLGFQFLNAV
jgi:hypothetical protein